MFFSTALFIYYVRSYLPPEPMIICMVDLEHQFL